MTSSTRSAEGLLPKSQPQEDITEEDDGSLEEFVVLFGYLVLLILGVLAGIVAIVLLS